MEKKNLEYISEKMKDIDLCMFTTKTKNGMLESRPMSNNGDVEYDGNSYFFAMEDSQKVQDIKQDAAVCLNFIAEDKMFIAVSGKATIVTSKDEMQEHWVPSLDKWFKDGIDTPGAIMIVVKAEKIIYWHNMEEGEIEL